MSQALKGKEIAIFIGQKKPLDYQQFHTVQTNINAIIAPLFQVRKLGLRG